MTDKWLEEMARREEEHPFPGASGGVRRHLDLAAARILLDSLGSVDTLDAQAVLLADALQIVRQGPLADLSSARQGLAAWEKLMVWRSARPPEVLYRELSPNRNPIDPTPTLIAEWGTTPRGNDDGAMAVGATGDTYGAAAVKLAGMLGLL